MRLVIPTGKVQFLDEMINGSDRVCAILGGTFADVALQKAIRKSLKNTGRIKELFDPKSELSGFKAKTELAFGMGLIGERPRYDLKIIGEIRNKFAHNLDIQDFEAQIIRDKCAALWLPKNANSVDLEQYWLDELKHPPEGKSIHRSHYEWTVAIIVGGLYAYAFARKGKPSPLIWN